MIHGWSAFGGPAMVEISSNWEKELERGLNRVWIGRVTHRSTSEAHTAEEKSAKSNGVNKSTKVVLSLTD
jgi:hypothetical protein